MPVIRPSKEQADEIAAVCSLGSETLSEIASIIEALPVTVRAEKIRAAISAKVGTAKAEALERVLLVFSVAIRRRFDNVPTLLDSVLLPLNGMMPSDRNGENAGRRLSACCQSSPSS
jgi:hypothetical protein